MSLAVYSRVGSLLQEAGVDLEELRGRIAVRYGRDIDERTLAALMQDGRLQRPDIELLEAVALTLDVRVDDLLDVRDVGMTGADFPSDDDILLDPERETRLRELTALRDGEDRPLTDAEADELETLIAAMRHALVERHIHAAARRLGVPVEVARERIMAQAKDAAEYYAALEADPALMAAEVKVAKERRHARAG